MPSVKSDGKRLCLKALVFRFLGYVCVLNSEKGEKN